MEQGNVFYSLRLEIVCKKEYVIYISYVRIVKDTLRFTSIMLIIIVVSFITRINVQFLR